MDRISIDRYPEHIKINIMAPEGGIIYEGMVTHKDFAELLTGMHNRNIETRTDTMMNKGSVNALNQIEKFFKTDRRIARLFNRVSDDLSEDQICGLATHIIATVEKLISMANGEASPDKQIIDKLKKIIDYYEEGQEQS